MGKKDTIRWLITCAGTIVLYVIMGASLFIIYGQAIPVIIPNENKDLAQVILASISNAVTVSLGFADIIAAVALILCKKIPKWRILLFSISFLLLIIFNSVALNYPLSVAWVVLVDLTFFVIISAILAFSATSKHPQLTTKKTRIIKNINNKKIICAQIFAVKQELIDDETVFTLNSIEHSTKDNHDINGILSVTYRLPDQDYVTFQIIYRTYLSFVNDGNEQTKKNLIDQLLREKDRLIDRLKTIDKPESVNITDCYIARVLMIYLAFLKILDPQSSRTPKGWSGGEGYIGELFLEKNMLGIDSEIENRLLTLMRTGVFGAVLLGHEVRYIFNYHKSGYKAGRRYSAICLPTPDGRASNKVCVLSLDNTGTEKVPTYLVTAIQREEARITKAFHSLEEGSKA